MSSRPFNPRRISRDALAYRNLISHRRAPMRFEWLGKRWQLELMICDRVREGLHSIEADWGGARLVLRADAFWLDDVAAAVTGVPATPSMPALVVQAVLETAFAQASNLLEKTTRKQLRIVAFNPASADLDGMEGFGWLLDCDGATQQGELWTDELGLGFLSSALHPLNLLPLDDGEMDALPIPVRFSLGWVDLPVHELSSLAKADVLVMDECWLQEDACLSVRVGSKAFRAVLRNTTLDVTEGWRTLMDEELDLDDDDEVDSLQDIPVRLSFDLGERTVTLGELRAIAPGYVFDLGRELRRAVVIRANGKAIGDGELVDLDGRTGVSIMNIKAAGRSNPAPSDDE